MCTSLLMWNKVDGMKTQKEWLLTKDVAKEFDLKEDTLKKQRYLSRLKEKTIEVVPNRHHSPPKFKNKIEEEIYRLTKKK